MDARAAKSGKHTATPTASSGSSRPTSTTGNSTTGGGGGGGSGLDALFPIADSVAKWTTLPGAPGALPLSDDTLKPFKVMAGTTHDFVAAPDGKQAMEAKYPKGSYIPSKQPRGGFSFYAPGPADVDFTTAKELTFGYSIMFPQGFQFVKGGKLPGIYGGDDATTAVSCSGGRRDPTCFSARIMWRPEGAGELYTYLPDPSDPQFAANDKLCKMPNSECNPTYGASIQRGAFTFPTGEWLTISERVKLNTAGEADGELELFVGGKSVISATGLIIRDSDKGRMRGIQACRPLLEIHSRLNNFQTFFGGATPDWASPVDQQVFFADFSVAIISKL
ncbi:polysaccharide lyase family 14 protein [Mycena vulgaris]|nr:polysaccharide lyase family 14 protein [Mycena vulgaris]